MKKLFLIPALFAMALSFLFVSCSKDNDEDDNLFTESHETGERVADLSQDFEAIIGHVTFDEGDAQTLPSLINDGIPCLVDEAGSEMRSNSQSGLSTPCQPCNCNGLFAQMDLSDAQKTRIRRSMAAYNQCIKDARERLASLHRELMEEYKLEFTKLQRQLRAGRITEDQFKRMAYRLRMHYGNKFENLQSRHNLCRAIASCHRTYLENVRSILNDRQWARFAQCQRRCMSQAQDRANNSQSNSRN